jgi:hypothetical protein
LSVWNAWPKACMSFLPTTAASAAAAAPHMLSSHAAAVECSATKLGETSIGCVFLTQDWAQGPKKGFSIGDISG